MGSATPKCTNGTLDLDTSRVAPLLTPDLRVACASEDGIVLFPPYIQSTATVFCVVVLVVGTVGNLLVPVVVCRTKELRNSTNIFLINLSVADLLVLLVCMPTVLIELHSRPEVWLLGHGMCKIVPFVELTVAHGSILTILAISFERYYAICKPLKAGYTCTKMRALAIILALWVVALLVTTPVFAIVEYTFERYIDGSTVPVCLTKASLMWQKGYFFLVTAAFFWLPFVILIALYTVIARHLMMDRRLLNNATERCRMRSRKQVVVMVACIMVCFFVCLMPFRIFTVWLIVVPEERVRAMGMEAYYNVLYFSRVMLYINSAINPVLYNLISSKFREAFLRVICCNSRHRLIRQGTSSTTYTSLTLQNSLRGGPLRHTISKTDSTGKCPTESCL